MATQLETSFSENLSALIKSTPGDTNDLLIKDMAKEKEKIIATHNAQQIKYENCKEKARALYEQRQREKGLELKPVGRPSTQKEKIEEAELKIEELQNSDAKTENDKLAEEIINADIIETDQAIIDMGLPNFADKYTKTSKKYPSQKALAMANAEVQQTPKLVPQGSLPNANELKQMRSTSRKEISRLMDQLNINLDVQLSKTDTFNLLACLLTCNETQLQALYRNPKIPLAIKTIVKRIIDDAKVGDISTVEKLWDRVFGKNAQLQNDNQLENILIPKTPVSREAYIVLRDTLIGK